MGYTHFSSFFYKIKTSEQGTKWEVHRETIPTNMIIWNDIFNRFAVG